MIFSSFRQKFFQINVSLIYRLKNIKIIICPSIDDFNFSCFRILSLILLTNPLSPLLSLSDAKPTQSGGAQQGDHSGGRNRKIAQIDRPSKDFDWSYYLVKTRQEWKPAWQMYLTMYGTEPINLHVTCVSPRVNTITRQSTSKWFHAILHEPCQPIQSSALPIHV